MEKDTHETQRFIRILCTDGGNSNDGCYSTGVQLILQYRGGTNCGF